MLRDYIWDKTKRWEKAAQFADIVKIKVNGVRGGEGTYYMPILATRSDPYRLPAPGFRLFSAIFQLNIPDIWSGQLWQVKIPL